MTLSVSSSTHFIFSERNIIQIKDFSFTPDGEAKDRYAIILEQPRDNGKFLMATTSASFMLPPRCSFKEGIVKDDSGRFICYHFPKDIPVCENGIFKFPKHSSISLLNRISVFEKEISALSSTYTGKISLQGTLTVDHHKELVYSIYKSRFITPYLQSLILPCVEKYHGKLNS